MTRKVGNRRAGTDCNRITELGLPLIQFETCTHKLPFYFVWVFNYLKFNSTGIFFFSFFLLVLRECWLVLPKAIWCPFHPATSISLQT